MTNCSITIIIPAYNVEKYLGDALDSILEQSVNPDELVLIDDGSTDQTLAIANTYEFSFPYKVVSIENSGQGNARNIGANLATSKYIYYFDSDDILDKSFVKDMKQHIQHCNEPDIILFSGESFNDKEYKGNRWVSYMRGFSGSFDNRINFLRKGYLKNGLFCSPCLYISKKKLWNKDKLSFGINYLEDEAIFYPLLFTCQSFTVLNKVYFYRRNRNNSTMTMMQSSKHIKGAIYCIECTLSLYSSKDFSKDEEWYIRNRLKRHCVSYILMSKKSNSKINYKKITDAFVATRSVSFISQVMVYMTGMNKIKAISKIGNFKKINKR